MSRYDYRVRRKLFNRGQENSHKDFNSFERKYNQRHRIQRASRFLLILIALIVLIGIAVFAAKADNIKKKSAPLESEKELAHTKNPL